MSDELSELEQAVALAVNLSPVDKVRLVEQVMATLERDLTQTKKPKRSLLGLWSGVNLSSDDIDQARREMWGNFPREDD
jgi:hypothetical protein